MTRSSPASEVRPNRRVFGRSATRLPGLLLVAALVLTGLPLAAQAPDLLYLKFNEGTGTSTADSAVPGSGVAATLQPGAGWDTTGPKLGAAALKAGPNPGAVVTTNAPFSLSGSWTIECWFTDLSGSPVASLFGDTSASSFVCYRSFGFTGTDILLVGGGLNNVVISGFSASGWVHLAYVHDATTNDVKAYVNGNLATTTSQPSGLTITGSSASGLVIGADSVSGAVWTGSIDEFRIWGVARSQADIVANMNQEIAGFADDLALTSLDAPSPPAQACAPLSSTETVGFTVRNTGANAIAPGTSFVVSHSVNGGSPQAESFFVSGSLAPGQSQSFSFVGTADLSQPGERQVSLNLNYIPDLNPLNDVLVETFAPGVGLVSSFPWTETFDLLPAGFGSTPPAGWTQDANDDSGVDADWHFLDGATPTANTGPTADHSSGLAGQGHFAYVEDSQANHAQVNLLGPCLDLAGLSSPRLIFWLHSRNDQSPTTTFENSLSVDLIDVAGNVTLDALGPIGHLGADWQRFGLDLGPYAGSVVQLRFRGRSDGGGGKHDMAIDDVTVADVFPGNGQAPQAGLATLDLNAASSPQYGGVASGDPGPYAAGASVGGPLVFVMGGQPGQPIILLIGTLNPVAATFPNVGQMDIGGAVDPMTGIPTGIQVLGNGFTPIDFIDLLFVVGAGGETTLGFATPALPLGVIGAFQAAFATGPAQPLALSNAVELTIN
ncbi:MAG: hypothetical protein H6807_13775 [Planctomycetes bacterium]|nr:hypothetical protein [Planctomycetota bacterium]